MIEVLIAALILAIIFSLGIFVSWDFYRQYQLESESETLVSLLRYVRNFAMVNRNEADHGLYFDSNNFVVFQGPTYATRNVSEDRPFARPAGITLSGPSELVFSRLSGAIASSSYALTAAGRQRVINVNSEGTVYYEE